MPRFSPILLASLSLAASIVLSGCSANFDAVNPTSIAGQTLRGNVHGGQSPVSGAAVYLFAASASGYGAPNQSLLQIGLPGVKLDGADNGFVTSDAGGGFTITGDYTCPAGALVYIVAASGNPGLAPGTMNPALVEIAALGPCSNFTSNSFILVNEVTTVAAITALAPFSNAILNSISTSPTNVLGLTNAFATANNLVNLTTGAPRATTLSGLGTVPVAEINTLADILATCVNSTGIGAPCSTLFAATTPVGSTPPTNTAQAMYNIATNPALNVATLYNMVTANAPFAPTLTPGYNNFTGTYTGVPNDWTIGISYASPSLTAPNYVAIDSQSNVWTVSGQTLSAIQFSNAGAINVIAKNVGDGQFSTNNYNQALAVDLNDSLWIDNNSYGVTVVSKTGHLTTAGVSNYGYEPGNGTNSGFSSDYLRGYGGIAIDASGNAWIGSASNSASTLVEASPTGYGLGNYSGGGLSNPTSVALDSSGNIWLASNGTSPGGAVKFSSAGAVLSGAAPYPTQSGSIAVAIDHANEALIANYNANTITVLSSAGVASPNSPYYGGGLKGPSDVAIDGNGNVWLSNFFSNGGVSEFNNVTGNPITPALGYYSGSQGAMLGAVAIDASGNVWTSNWGGSTLNELVGAAAPTITPVALATKNNMIGVKP